MWLVVRSPYRQASGMQGLSRCLGVYVEVLTEPQRRPPLLVQPDGLSNIVIGELALIAASGDPLALKVGYNRRSMNPVALRQLRDADATQVRSRHLTGFLAVEPTLQLPNLRHLAVTDYASGAFTCRQVQPGLSEARHAGRSRLHLFEGLNVRRPVRSRPLWQGERKA